RDVPFIADGHSHGKPGHRIGYLGRVTGGCTRIGRKPACAPCNPRQLSSTTRSRSCFLQWCVPSHTAGGTTPGRELCLSLPAARRCVCTMGKQPLEPC